MQRLSVVTPVKMRASCLRQLVLLQVVVLHGVPTLTVTPTVASSTRAGPQPNGKTFPAMRAFDKVVTDFMAAHAVPGLSVAVTVRGQLAYQQGYGSANISSNTKSNRTRCSALRRSPRCTRRQPSSCWSSKDACVSTTPSLAPTVCYVASRARCHPTMVQSSTREHATSQ